jgi:hypothetical protein
MRSGGKLHAFLNGALDGGKWLVLRPDGFILGASTLRIGGSAGPTAGLDAVVKKQNHFIGI